MSVPSSGSACPSPSRSDISLESVSKHTRPDATVEYYRLVPGQYLNVPIEATDRLSRRRVLSAGTVQSVAKGNRNTAPSSHSIEANTSTYQTHSRHSSSPTSTSIGSRRTSFSTTETWSTFSPGADHHSTPPTSANNSPLNLHNILFPSSTQKPPAPLSRMNKPRSVAHKSEDSILSPRAFASCPSSPIGSTSTLRALRRSTPVTPHPNLSDSVDPRTATPEDLSLRTTWNDEILGSPSDTSPSSRARTLRRSQKFEELHSVAALDRSPSINSCMALVEYEDIESEMGYPSSSRSVGHLEPVALSTSPTSHPNHVPELDALVLNPRAVHTALRNIGRHKNAVGASQLYLPHEQTLELFTEDLDDDDIYCPFTSATKNTRPLISSFLSKRVPRVREQNLFGHVTMYNQEPFEDGEFHADIRENHELPNVGPDWVTTGILTEDHGIRSTVYTCRNRVRRGLFAIQRIEAEQPVGEKSGRILLNNIKVLALLQDLNKPFLLGPCTRTDLWAWRDAESICLVTDLCSGNLDSLAGKLLESQCPLIIAEIGLGLEALHSLGIVHHDLCPQNIFVASDGHIKVGSFHASQFLRPGYSLERAQNESSFLANIQYSAPELWTYDAHGISCYDEMIDYWSFGVTLFKLSAGKSLFSDTGSDLETIQCIRRGPTYAWQRIPGSDDFRDLVTQLLQMNPAKRLKAKNLKKHKYLSNLTGKWKQIAEMKYTAPFEQRELAASARPAQNSIIQQLESNQSGNAKSCNLIQLLHRQGLDVVCRS